MIPTQQRDIIKISFITFSLFTCIGILYLLFNQISKLNRFEQEILSLHNQEEIIEQDLLKLNYQQAHNFDIINQKVQQLTDQWTVVSNALKSSFPKLKPSIKQYDTFIQKTQNNIEELKSQFALNAVSKYFISSSSHTLAKKWPSSGTRLLNLSNLLFEYHLLPTHEKHSNIIDSIEALKRSRPFYHDKQKLKIYE